MRRAGVGSWWICVLWSVAAWAADPVAVVRSDWRRLPHPVPANQELDLAQTEMLVRGAMDQLGGMRRFVGPRVRWVFIKPNLVTPTARGSGDITDAYVVWALARLVHQANPAARISIGDGPGEYVTPGHPEALQARPEIDGFRLAGLTEILADPDLADARLELVDLNLDESVERVGAATGQSYWIARSIQDCDVFINVPVLKVTSSIGFTCAMKNLVGILPGLRYGWPKSNGFPPESGAPGIPNHYEERFDELIVDLHSIGRVDLAVVDAIVGMERGRVQAWGGRPRRLNTIVAGRDPVAVDAVCTHLVGYNPDDFEFLTLAERLGLGHADWAAIETVGQPLNQLATRFEKVPADNDPPAHFGQSNRVWLAKGPFALADSSRWRPDPAAPPPVAGVDGWSHELYFDDDRLGFDHAFGRPATPAVGYAAARFAAPRAQTAELWLGSSDDLVVWLNGQCVYSYQGIRNHRLPNDRVTVPIVAGENRLLVELAHHRRDSAFTLNVCAPETDRRYDGNRVAGLRFYTGERQAEARRGRRYRSLWRR